MKLYFVTAAPEGNFILNRNGHIQPEAFTTLESAEEHAGLMAREYPGLKVLIVEGEPIRALLVDLAPIREIPIDD